MALKRNAVSLQSQYIVCELWMMFSYLLGHQIFSSTSGTAGNTCATKAKTVMRTDLRYLQQI